MSTVMISGLLACNSHTRTGMDAEKESFSATDRDVIIDSDASEVGSDGVAWSEETGDRKVILEQEQDAWNEHVREPEYGRDMAEGKGEALDGTREMDPGSGGEREVPAESMDFPPDGREIDGHPENEASYDFRNSLAICWTDANCKRVMAVGHGGLWNVTSAPYDSNAALKAAYEAGMDGVKIDVRVTADNVPVISHSSPIEFYESIDCSGKRIEDMTAAEVTKCHRAPSLTETFQRLDDVLDYLRGKMVVQLCVKRSKDYGRTIEEIHAKGAEDFAFMEISTDELQNLIPTLQGSDSVYYLINVGSNLADVDKLLDSIKNPMAFMYEFDPTVDVSDMVRARLHPAGVRAFTYDDTKAALAAHFQKLYDGGYDVVSANVGNALIQARISVNQSRGLDPP
ncbi:MAG: glycerophosphodiester phosphodiesterase family protein [Deltaproteobacteria bacterium]|nr:glycerophosphodiester phosphodiesterase family protein [Deltaproteobacteria bacterium]